MTFYSEKEEKLSGAHADPGYKERTGLECDCYGDIVEGQRPEEPVNQSLWKKTGVYMHM